jgi:hypothetical protein
MAAKLQNGGDRIHHCSHQSLVEIRVKPDEKRLQIGFSVVSSSGESLLNVLLLLNYSVILRDLPKIK